MLAKAISADVDTMTPTGFGINVSDLLTPGTAHNLAMSLGDSSDLGAASCGPPTAASADALGGIADSMVLDAHAISRTSANLDDSQEPLSKRPRLEQVETPGPHYVTSVANNSQALCGAANMCSTADCNQGVAARGGSGGSKGGGSDIEGCDRGGSGNGVSCSRGGKSAFGSADSGGANVARTAGAGSNLRTKRPPGATDLRLDGTTGAHIQCSLRDAAAPFSLIPKDETSPTPNSMLSSFAAQLSPHVSEKFGVTQSAMLDFLTTDDVLDQLAMESHPELRHGCSSASGGHGSEVADGDVGATAADCFLADR